MGAKRGGGQARRRAIRRADFEIVGGMKLASGVVRCELGWTRGEIRDQQSEVE